MAQLLRWSLACCLLTTTALAQPQSYNTTLFGTINPEPPTGGERYSALTGWAAPNGREYALLGGFSGTYIIDVTQAPIKQVAFIDGPHNGWREMKTVGSYGYVVSEGGAGLQIIDLSQLPAKATLVKSDTTFFRSAHTISTDGKYLFVNGTGASAGANGGVIILDITNPIKPVKVSQWADRYSHDCVIRKDTMYVSAINNGELDVVALGADRKSPHTVTSITYPGAGTHNSDLTPDGSYIITTDEINATPKTLKVWDRRDIGSIAKVADFTMVPNEIVHNIHMKGSIAYVAWYSAGTRVIDMSVPSAPAELGYYDTYPGAENNYVGNWGTYPYLPSGKIISSDMSTGLYVFTFNGAKRASVHGVVRDSATKAPLPGATITLNSFGRVITADAQGNYNYAGAVDTLAFTARATNYFGVSGALVLAEAGSQQDILLPALRLANFRIQAVDAATGTPLDTFAYRVMERPANDGLSQANPQTFAVPMDSTYHIYVGAWGYLPRLLVLRNPTGDTIVRLNPGYFDDAELDFEWSFAATGDNAKAGQWERGVPVLTGLAANQIAQPGHDTSADPGNHAFITGITGSDGGVGANDVDDGVTSLTSPPMDLRAYRNPILTCSIWYSRDLRNDAINDTLDVMISGDGGGTWRMMEHITASPQRWVQKRYRLKDYYTQPGQRTLFRIAASDLYDQSLVEAGMDDFAVSDSGRQLFGVRQDMAAAGVTATRLHPNPFGAGATLDLSIARAQHAARLDLFDATGRLVHTLYTGALAAGPHSFAINGGELASGRYTWRLVLDDGSVVSGSAVVVR